MALLQFVDIVEFMARTDKIKACQRFRRESDRSGQGTDRSETKGV
jgi:hypothetical protein